MNSTRKKELIGFYTLLLSGLLLLGWIGSLAAARIESRNDWAYSGRIPYKTRILLNRMQDDLRSADRITCSRSDRLVYLDEEGISHEFSYMYGALWQDDYPFMTDVKDFHFEFRDERGNLLNANCSPTEIVTIGYILHLSDQNKEVLANLSVRLSSKKYDWTKPFAVAVQIN